ncbi:MAG: hypothetical protein L0332_07120 [Chloroflexi bacterium]|nr:hypothetical protein [Chloroflexota bacterium]MCI0575661.1 hypothetical protein [Chloroflexota bacterium]MCI0643944.1 hypothetical protein [Chloroflexota bacterium]MCI0726480.1 hypothetical protein [Chloroflexota bacterium]
MAVVPIRELKRRYKMNLALGRALPLHDLAVPLPLSTGNPLYDAALTDKLVVTRTLSEAEHLNRGWSLVRQSSPAERQALAGEARSLLNDYKLLLALQAWQGGDEGLARTFLEALPWHWRLAFPIAVLKPAAHIFTGWRRALRFRLVEDPRYPALRALFRELLAQAPNVAVLKYRQTIKASAALQRYRFEGEREEAIHRLCFDNGRGLEDSQLLEPVGAYLRARQALAAGDVGAFLRALENGRREIPLTSFMGLLGSAGLRLNDQHSPQAAGLRDYAVRCATAVESLLRLREWGDWLTGGHIRLLADKVRHGIVERGLDIPFHKVTQAFINAPHRVRQLTLEPLYIPLMRHFGRQAAGLLPEPGPLSYVQPGNVIHLMSFLLYTVLSSAMPARLFLLYQDGVEEVPPLDLEEVARHLADAPNALEQWLLSEFGGLATHYSYTYDYAAVARVLAELDPQAPLVLDLPFAQSMEILAALLPFERAFNLSTVFGAPGEVCLAYDYYANLILATSFWHFGIWQRNSDSAAQRFAEFLDRLRAFQALAAGVPGGEA